MSSETLAGRYRQWLLRPMSEVDQPPPMSDPRADPVSPIPAAVPWAKLWNDLPVVFRERGPDGEMCLFVDYRKASEAHRVILSQARAAVEAQYAHEIEGWKRQNALLISARDAFDDERRFQRQRAEAAEAEIAALRSVPKRKI